jgi:hypothetical protein
MCARNPSDWRQRVPAISVTMTEMALCLVRRLIWLVAAALGAFGLMAHYSAAQLFSARPVVVVVPIEGVIDLGLAPFVKRVLEDAAETRAAAVVGGADENLDYLELVHVLVRRPHASGLAVLEVGQAHRGDHQATGLPDEECS